VRRGLTVTVFIRQQSVDKFTTRLEGLNIKDRVTLHVGDFADKTALQTAMTDSKAGCVISLLASPQVTDEQDIYDVDYTLSHNVVEACRQTGIKQMIYCSDTGVYQPGLCCQMHKLRIEGELFRSLPDGLQYTIIRPTSYHPYVVSAMVLESVRKGEAVPLFGAKEDAGNLAVYNPIAREDLGRFIVSCVLNQSTYGRVMPVGGPWAASNVCTLRDTAEWMIDIASPSGKTSTIKSLGMDLSDIVYKALEAIGHLSPMIKHVATIVFYYTKYWSTVSHFSPATGTMPAKAYAAELVAAMKQDPDAFEKFISNARESTTASVVYPTPLSSWWDISKPSLTPEQIPMGAGTLGRDEMNAVARNTTAISLKDTHTADLKRPLAQQTTLSVAAGEKSDWVKLDMSPASVTHAPAKSMHDHVPGVRALKIKTDFNGDKRRISTLVTSLSALQATVQHLYHLENAVLKYLDDEGDQVTLQTQEDFEMASKLVEDGFLSPVLKVVVSQNQ